MWMFKTIDKNGQAHDSMLARTPEAFKIISDILDKSNEQYIIQPVTTHELPNPEEC